MNHALSGLVRVFTGGLIAVLVTIGFACGGGGDDDEASPTPTAEETEEATATPEGEGDGAGSDAEALEDYFAELRAIIDNNGEQAAALEEMYPDAFEDPQETADWYVGFLALFEDVRDQIADVDPPEALEDEHEDFVGSAEAIPELIETVQEALEDIETLDEMDDFFAEDEDYFALDAAFADFGAACQALQDVADEEGVDVDLDCGGEDTGGLSLEDYFAELQEIRDAGDEELDALGQQLNSDLDDAETLDEEIAVFQTFLDDSLSVIFGTAFQLSFMVPPAEVAELHNAYLGTVEDFAQILEDLRNDLDSAETEDEAAELIDAFNVEVDESKDESVGICFDLQAIADDNNVDVDLGCGE